jgi:uracil-DNA glycosylase
MIGFNKELTALAQAVKTCDRCAISQKRRNAVFGEGDPASPLVIVGEGPGDQEDATGRPFVGRSGQMLDRALADCGLSREEVFICNTVKCRACDWVDGKPQNRPPTPEETANCKPWLLEQLALIKPKVILCVGAPSAKNLIDSKFKITQQRGVFFASEVSKTILATLHPSYIMRQQRADNDGGYGLLVADIQNAWDAAIRLRKKETGQP